MQNVLIISGHPNLNASIANREILNELEKALPTAQIRRLDTLYPTYQFNVEAEQAAILAADVLVFQFPFSWYSVPGLMKLWLDQVFTHGFAHGSTAQLGGKKVIFSFTTGAPSALYQLDGLFRHNVEDYLAQFETFATLCGLVYLPPIYTTGISYVGRDEAKIAEQQTLAKAHAARLIAAIKHA